MRDFVILTDSCCDLDIKMRKDIGVEDYIKMIVTYNNKETFCDLEWNEFSAKEFYDNMRAGIRYRTTQITFDMYIKKFEKYLQEGKDILSVTCSSALSGSINSSILAKNELKEKYPEAKIICIDTLRGSLGQGLLVYFAANLKKEGKTIDEIALWLDENKNNVNQVGTVDDLVYLKRAGRVTGAAAFMGKILKIKPIIIADAKGQNLSLGKVRGRKTSLKEIINYVKENITDAKNQTVFIAHADCLEDALFIKEDLLNEIGCKDVYINYVGISIGATVGPGMIGVYFYGKKVTIVGKD